MSILPYEQWPRESHARLITFTHTFGRHLMKAARDYSFERIPAGASEEARELAKKAALDAIYGVLMLVDGIYMNKIGEGLAVDYVLSARVRDRSDEPRVIENVELAPSGEGVCIGFHGWVKDEYDWEKLVEGN